MAGKRVSKGDIPANTAHRKDDTAPHGKLLRFGVRFRDGLQGQLNALQREVQFMSDCTITRHDAVAQMLAQMLAMHAGRFETWMGCHLYADAMHGRLPHVRLLEFHCLVHTLQSWLSSPILQQRQQQTTDQRLKDGESEAISLVGVIAFEAESVPSKRSSTRQAAAAPQTSATML